jgi:hypothetical protein
MPVMHAQSIRYPVSLPYINLTAYSNKQNDPVSFISNQAALAGIQQIGIGIYGEQRFSLAANSSYIAAACLPTTKGNLGLQLNYAGFKNFNESKVGLAYAKSLGKKVDVGMQFNYYSYRVPAYAIASSVNVEAGLVLHLSEQLNAGVHLYNPLRSKLGKSGEEKLAAAYQFGLGYDASDNFFVGAEISKEEDKPVTANAGFQYHFSRQFFARAGFVSASSILFAGAGVGWKSMRFDISASYHPQLGFSPGVLVIANSGNPKKK